MMLKNALKDKLAGSDIFGRLEYPLGMFSGMVRFLCGLIIVMSLLHAKLITDAEIQKAAKEQLDALGSSFFPSLGEIQRSIFVKSFTGNALDRSVVNIVLIAPSSDKGEDLGKKEGPARRSERSWELK
jgi:hypothetical protein